MGAARYELLLTNPSGTQILLDPIGPADAGSASPGFSTMAAKPRHNEAGFGEFTTTARPELMDAINTPDTRVLVRRTDENTGQVGIVMAGPVELPEDGYEASRDGTDGYGLVDVKFTDDRVWLGYRLVYPAPNLPPISQNTTRYAFSGVSPEQVMYSIVALNAGPSALTERRITGLSIAPFANLQPGKVVSGSFTRDTLALDALREVSRLSGTPGLGFRIVQNGLSGMQFQVFLPADRTTSAVFARQLGNIATLTYSQSAPTATVAIVGDATAGPNRVIKERINTAAHTAGWVRREVFVDGRNAANATELEQAGDAALAEAGPKTRFAFQAIETPDLRFGYDYGIGDQVSAQPYTGGPFLTALVLGADITYSDQREKVVPIIGTDTELLDDAKAAEIRKLWRTIARLQGSL